MSTLPRLMILGGGSSQINAFRRAREHGFFTVLADHNPDAPARPLADGFAQASTFDVQAVTDAARAWRVDALLAIGTDQPVLTAAIVSDRLGLPFPLSPVQARELTNKAPMKRRFADAGIPSAAWAILGPDPATWDADGLARLSFPLVAKPVDSQGQRGIAVVGNRDELLSHRPELLSHSRENIMLVEEFYPSTEVTVSGWVADDGTVELWTITDRITFGAEHSLGVCVAHRYPSHHVRGRGRLPFGYDPNVAHGPSHLGDADVGEEVSALTRRIVAVFGLTNGPIYFQMLIGERGVLVNEIAFRLGGAYEDQSLPLVTGVDVLGRQLTSIARAIERRGGRCLDRFAAASPDHVASLERRSTAFCVPLMFCRPGTITAFHGADEMSAQPGVAACRFLLPVGTRIVPMTNSTQRVAYAVLHGGSPAAVNTLIDTLFDTLRVSDADGNNMLLDTRAMMKLSDDG